MRIQYSLVLFLYFNLLSVSYSQNSDNEDPTKWKYFKVYVNEEDGPLFKSISNELGLSITDMDEFDIEFVRGRTGDFVLGGMYQMVVNISDDQPQNQYVVVGEFSGKNIEKGFRSIRYAWSQISLKNQIALLNWKGENKVKVDAQLKSLTNDLDPKHWTYFKVYVRTDDDNIFSLLQDDLGIQPKLEYYSIVVNISDPNVQNQYLVLGDELDPSSQRFAWTQISRKVQDGLLNWTGTNKINNEFAQNYKVGAKQFEVVIKLNKNHPSLYYLYFLKGKYEYLAKDYNVSALSFSKAIDINPDFIKSYEERGRAYNSDKVYQKAITDFDYVIQHNDKNAKAHGYRGEAYYGLHQFKAAIEDFETSIKLNPNNYMASVYQWYIDDSKKKIK